MEKPFENILHIWEALDDLAHQVCVKEEFSLYWKEEVANFKNILDKYLV